MNKRAVILLIIVLIGLARFSGIAYAETTLQQIGEMLKRMSNGGVDAECVISIGTPLVSSNDDLKDPGRPVYVWHTYLQNIYNYILDYITSSATGTQDWANQIDSTFETCEMSAHSNGNIAYVVVVIQNSMQEHTQNLIRQVQLNNLNNMHNSIFENLCDSSTTKTYLILNYRGLSEDAAAVISWKKRNGEGNYCITIFASDDMKENIINFIKAIQNGQQQEESGPGGSRGGQDNGPVIVQTPASNLIKEMYVAIPVIANGRGKIEVKIDGQDYQANVVCNKNLCLAIVPKDLLKGRDLCVDPQKGKVMQRRQGDTCEKSLTFYDGGATTVTRIVETLGNEKIATYYAKGYVPAKIDVNVPKINGRVPKIYGDFPVVNLDPVLRITLNSTGGNIAVEKVVVEKDANIIDQKIAFASCALEVRNVKTTVEHKDGYRISINFSIKDGDDKVYVQNVKVTIGGREVKPQFDPTTMTYFASSPVIPGNQRVTITASAEGCSDLIYTREVYVGKSVWEDVAGFLMVLAAVVVAYVALRYAMWGGA